MFGQPFGLMDLPNLGDRDSIQDLYEDAMEDIFDTLPLDPDPVQFQPEQENTTQEDSFLDELFSVAAVAGAAGIGYEFLAMEEEKKKQQLGGLGQPVFTDGIVEPFVVPELGD